MLNNVKKIIIIAIICMLVCLVPKSVYAEHTRTEAENAVKNALLVCQREGATETEKILSNSIDAIGKLTSGSNEYKQAIELAYNQAGKVNELIAQEKERKAKAGKANLGRNEVESKLDEAMKKAKEAGATNTENDLKEMKKKLGMANTAGSEYQAMLNTYFAAASNVQEKIEQEKRDELGADSEDKDESHGETSYGDPSDLIAQINPSSSGIGAVIFKYAKLIGIIVLFFAIVLLGTNIILNRNKGEERSSNLTGIFYIVLGVIILFAAMTIYSLVFSLMGGSTQGGEAGEASTINFFSERLM